MVNFNSTKAEGALIRRMVDRALRLYLEANPDADAQDFDTLSAEMDITACHCNGCPLRLRDMLEADDFNFSHDFFGIRRYINRETGKLNGGMFSPRFHRHDGACGAIPLRYPHC